MAKWLGPHKWVEKTSNQGLLWVAAAEDANGQKWVFRFAYEAGERHDEVLRNLDRGRPGDAGLDQHLNYLPWNEGRLEVARPTTRKFGWLIRAILPA